MKSKKKIVVIGGGTGSFVVLSGLKQYPLDLSVIVSTMDSGGSTGRLRDQYGIVPPGDLRQCLVALSEASELWRKLFLYRFDTGDFKGHNFGNIFLTALEKTTENYQDVVDTASYILQTKGKVIPVTFDKVSLCAQYSDGEVIETEKLIDTAFHKKTRIVKAYLKPRASVNKLAIEAIAEADYIIIGPGDLYTSLIPNLLVDGMQTAIKKSKAKLIAIVNLMTKQGQTTDYTARDFCQDLQMYTGREIDYSIIHNKKIPDEMLVAYKEFGEKVVADDMPKATSVIRMDLLSGDIYTQSKSDKSFRSLLRHDSQKTSEAILKIIE